MIVAPVLVISDLNLNSSPIDEPFAPSNYGSGTSYAKGAFVTDSNSLLVYQSLQDSNSGNDPATSPLWWELVGVKEVSFDNSHAYSAGDRAYYGHRTYTALQAATGKNPYSNPDYWEDSGPSLKYAMFDTVRGTASVWPSPLAVTITPATRVDTLSALGVKADTIQVVVTTSGQTVYDKTFDFVTRTALNWKDYFFKAFSRSTARLFQDLPPYTNGVIEVTFLRNSGNVEVGALCIGTAIELGDTQYSPDRESLNFSTIERDEFGNAILIPRIAIPKVTMTVQADTRRIPDILAAQVALNAVPAVYAGITDNESDYFPPLLILGFYTQWKLSLQDADRVIQTIELQEVG